MSQQLHTPKNYIEDIAEVCKNMQQFVVNATEDELSTNVMLQWSIIRGFEILGEAAKQLTEILPNAPARFPSIPFKDMYATRNRYIHGYATIHPPTVWKILQADIPALGIAAQAILNNWPADLA